MQLFLASSLEQSISAIVKSLPQNGKVLFIANAADPYEDTWWIESDRQAFLKHGFELVEADLRKLSADDFRKHLDNANIIHFGGGSVLYLMGLLKQKGFDSIVSDYVKSNKIIYTGTSAGSMIVAPSVALSQHDPEEEKFITDAGDLSGLNLVNFFIVPHCNSAKFDENKEMLKHISEYTMPILMIYDNQIVAVQDQTFKILSI
jgi:dipeptidase E